MQIVASTLSSLATIVAAMALLSLLEVLLPLRARSAWSRGHLAPNLVFSAITFATGAVFNAGIVAALAGLDRGGVGVLHGLALGDVPTLVVAVLTLDLSTYGAHVALHKVPVLWRFHATHHSDPTLDVSTTLRQHPVESLVRFAALAGVALSLGVSPSAYAVYRLLSVLTALLEHANVRVPASVDRLLSLVFTWPNLHKVHHSRDARLTNTNYGNVVSWWDRAFATFTPSRVGVNVVYGLDGYDDSSSQTTASLLTRPLRRDPSGMRPAPTDASDPRRASALRF